MLQLVFIATIIACHGLRDQSEDVEENNHRLSMTTNIKHNQTVSTGFDWQQAIQNSKPWNSENWLRFGDYNTDGMRMRQAAGTYCCWLESALEGLNHKGYIYTMFKNKLIHYTKERNSISWNTPSGKPDPRYGVPSDKFTPWKGTSPEWPTQAKWQQILMNVVYFPATREKSAQGMEKEDCPAAMGFGPEGKPTSDGQMQGRAPRLERRLQKIDKNIRVVGERLQLGKKATTTAKEIRKFIKTDAEKEPGTAVVFTLDKVNKDGSGHAIAVDDIVVNEDWADAWLINTYNQYKDEYSQYPAGEFSIARKECVSTASKTQCSDLYKFTITGLPQVG